MDKNMTLEKRIAAELYCYQGRMSVFVDDLQGHTVEVGADAIFGTDPDCDRLGVAVREKDGSFRLLTGRRDHL